MPILSDTSLGIYTYCLTKTPISFPFVIMGIDGEHEVCFAEQDSLYAIISNVSLKEFNEDALDKKMTDLAWVARMAKKHEEIIEFVMTQIPPKIPSPISSRSKGEERGETSISRGGQPFSPIFAKDNEEEVKNLLKKDIFTGKYYTPIVPLRFCTIYKNQEGLFKAIMPYKEKIMGFLNYIADKIEWSVKIFCDKKTFMNSHEKRNGKTVMIDQTPLLPGENYLLVKKMHKINEEAFKVDIQRILRDIHCALSRYVDRYRFLQCSDKSIHGKSFDMVMNTAFLIGQQTLTLFSDAMDILAKKYKNEGLVFEFTGPWPPYNFCPELSREK